MSRGRVGGGGEISVYINIYENIHIHCQLHYNREESEVTRTIEKNP